MTSVFHLYVYLFYKKINTVKTHDFSNIVAKYGATKASPDMRFSLGTQKKTGLSKFDISFSFVCLLFLQKIKYHQKTMI